MANKDTPVPALAAASLRSPAPFPFDDVAAKAVCNHCKKRGHFAAVCRSGKRLGSVELHSVAAVARNGRYVEVRVNGNPLVFKVDSGADVSVVPRTFPGCPAVLDKPRGEELFGPGKQALKLLGTFDAALSWRGRQVKERLYVVAGQEQPLLGYPAIVALGVVKFVGAVAPALPDAPPREVPPALFTGLGTFPEEYTIRIKPDAVPYALSTARRIPIPLRDVVKKELDKMEQEGVIRCVDEPTDWCAGLVVVPKPAGGYRLCVDLTKLNQVVLRERHVLPTVDQTLGLLGDARVFSKLDATSGFHQVRLARDSQKYTTFITPFGRYCYCRLPFGITSAPEYFQRQMSRLLEGLAGVVNLMDDILVFGRTTEEHDQRLQAVLGRLQQAGVTLNAAKCTFGVSSVRFLGVVVGANGITPDPEKVAAIQRMPAPQDVHGVQRFLGMLNHVGRFLPGLSQTTAPIRSLLNKLAAWTWGPAQASAFEKLKSMLSSDICLARYNPALLTTVSADASSFGLGAVLLQDQPSGERRPVAYASRALTETERRYSQIEKEALAATWAINRFDEFLRGLRFTLETDHKPLVQLLGTADLDLMPPRIQRFRIRLLQYQFDVKYVPGKQLATADALSRDPVVQLPATPAVDKVELYVQEALRAIPPTFAVLLDDFRAHQAADGECAQLKLYCEQGWPRKENLPLSMAQFWAHRAEFSIGDGLLLCGGRLLVPASLRKHVLSLIHDGHLGVNRCRAIARGAVWWPTMGSQIKTMVENCPNCATTRVHPAQRPRSYVVQTDAGALVRNRRHLVPQQSPSSGGLDLGSSSPRTRGSESLPQTPTRPEPVCSSPTPRALTPLPVASPPVAPATPSRPPGSVVRTRSGRCVRPPVRLNL
ncbi:uncharacterized protein K02A2.6-like [Dermacentor silvarum]|uniref:uncharacterized protein K02A2.6-like n=1 Tax=Dermacentor silvarum TaxID=543639 RepID=UPI0021008AD2|nr:uncharacterized protein K02A2.6-like [Dermacentor silvarum]